VIPGRNLAGDRPGEQFPERLPAGGRISQEQGGVLIGGDGRKDQITPRGRVQISGEGRLGVGRQQGRFQSLQLRDGD